MGSFSLGIEINYCVRVVRFAILDTLKEAYKEVIASLEGMYLPNYHSSGYVATNGFVFLRIH